MCKHRRGYGHKDIQGLYLIVMASHGTHKSQDVGVGLGLNAV